MQLAHRLSQIGESATLRVARLASELRREGVDVVDFGAGEPDFASPGVAVEAARAALADGFTKYTEGNGTPQLREAIATYLAERHGAPWQASDVIVTVGAKTGLFELALALFDSGDEVVLPRPFWVSFAEQIRFAGAAPVFVDLDGADGFTVRAEPLLAAITPRTRAVLINSPSNPTGGVMPADELAALVRGCAERGVVLISDETYERFLYDGARHASAGSIAAEFADTVVLVSSFSKTYAMTGWRLGYVAGPTWLLRALTKIQSHSTGNPTSFAMVGAVEALTGAEADVRTMVAEYQVRRDLLIPRLNAIPGVTCQPPAGAFYAFPDVSGALGSGRETPAELAEVLLKEAHVAVVPGEAFGSDRNVRISFACSREDLDRGLTRIATALGG